jgi:hypothetical protein
MTTRVGKTFLLTGVSTELGRAFAVGALKAGHIVVGTVRKPGDAEAFEALHPGRATPACWTPPTTPRWCASSTTSSPGWGPIGMLISTSATGMRHHRGVHPAPPGRYPAVARHPCLGRDPSPNHPRHVHIPVIARNLPETAPHMTALSPTLPPSTARAHLCDCAGHEVPQGAVNHPSIDGTDEVGGSIRRRPTGKEADEPADSWRERLEGLFGFDPLVQQPGESVVTWRERPSFIFGFDPTRQQPGESVVTWHRRPELIFGKEEVDAQFAFAHELLDAKSERGGVACSRTLAQEAPGGGPAGRAWITWLPVRPTSNRGGASDEPS